MNKKTLTVVALIGIFLLCTASATGLAIWYFVFRSTPKKALANIPTQLEKIETLKGSSEAYNSLKSELSNGTELYLTYENTTSLEIEEDVTHKMAYIVLTANDKNETNDPDELVYDNDYNSEIYIEDTDFYVKNEGEDAFTENNLGYINNAVTVEEETLTNWFDDRWEIWESISEIDIEDMEVSTVELDGKKVYKFVVTDVDVINDLSDDYDIYYMKEYFESGGMEAIVTAELTFWLLKDGTPCQRDLNVETIGTQEEDGVSYKMTYKSVSTSKILETNVSVDVEIPE
ncbi:hypothetical protein JW962_02435 [Candidatus Dojkabacteria bacterium]|nr:hypothetical protein [Candidatus Dojkabacteria bacterium]